MDAPLLVHCLFPLLEIIAGQVLQQSGACGLVSSRERTESPAKLLVVESAVWIFDCIINSVLVEEGGGGGWWVFGTWWLLGPAALSVRSNSTTDHSRTFFINYDSYLNSSKNSAIGEWKSAEQFLSPTQRCLSQVLQHEVVRVLQT
jgi:hypothetical protein